MFWGSRDWWARNLHPKQGDLAICGSRSPLQGLCLTLQTAGMFSAVTKTLRGKHGLSLAE
jgi:hypothetical protein